MFNIVNYLKNQSELKNSPDYGLILKIIKKEKKFNLFF